MKNMKTLKFSKRPLVNLGNSRTTKYRKKIKALENQKKNGQTLDNFLSKDIDNQDSASDKEIDEKNVSFTDMIENKLKFEANSLTPGHKIQLKAVQHYLQLLNKRHAKIEASQIVADLLNREKWFARCVRSWAKSFIKYGDVPKINHGQHLKG